MPKLLLALFLTLPTSLAHAEDLCVSRMSFVESQNLLVFQTTRDGVPPLTLADGLWATMFAQLLGADFPVDVETAAEPGGIWWAVDGMVFQQRPSQPPESLEQALALAAQPETGGHLRLELDGPGCLKGTLSKNTLALATPSGHRLKITLEALTAVPNATKNPKARVFSYKGAAVFKLSRR